MKTIIVWFRNDLRVHDHPALSRAVQDADVVIPLFIFDQKILHGRHSGSNRNRFLLECLQDLKSSLAAAAGDLVVRDGMASEVLPELAATYNVEAVYYTADYSPYVIARDKELHQKLQTKNVLFRSFPGRLIVSSLDKLHTKTGKVHKVFTPYYRNWLEIGRRELAAVPDDVRLPSGIDPGQLPRLGEVTTDSDLSPDALRGGESEARVRLKQFLDGPIAQYKTASNDMAADSTSRLSSYLHFGALSPLEIETMLPKGSGAEAWHRQLCWREFYHYILFHFPDNSKQEFQERYRKLAWGKDDTLLKAWESGATGYPVVDAAMRQLNQEGWMHNRARLIVGSFLTKDLWLDWRLGERYFMRMLIDGDQANNNGNWQWIASVGVDPAPVFRRLYNPTTQQQNYDPTGAYVRKYVPELRHVPEKYLTEPWNMPDDVQREAHCIIGVDYPPPVVNHADARKFALEQYRNTATDDLAEKNI